MAQSDPGWFLKLESAELYFRDRWAPGMSVRPIAEDLDKYFGVDLRVGIHDYILAIKGVRCEEYTTRRVPREVFPQ
jgi:hypothetical protein